MDEAELRDCQICRHCLVRTTDSVWCGLTSSVVKVSDEEFFCERFEETEI